MQVQNKPDFTIDDATCKAQTGKTLGEWFAVLDSIDGLTKGRRDSANHIYGMIEGTDAWWPTTIFVEYEKHKGILKKDGLQEGYTICCTKSIAAPVSKTYATWTDPKGFAAMFGDSGKQEVKEGGKIGCDAGCKAEFSRVRPDKDLRFTWEHPGSTAPITVDVQFQDNKGKTLMNVMSSRIQTRDEADGLRNAWGEALTRLKSLAEA